LKQVEAIHSAKHLNPLSREPNCMRYDHVLVVSVLLSIFVYSGLPVLVGLYTVATIACPLSSVSSLVKAVVDNLPCIADL